VLRVVLHLVLLLLRRLGGSTGCGTMPDHEAASHHSVASAPAWTCAAVLPSLPVVRPAPTKNPKGVCTLNIEDEMILYTLQQRPLNGPLNLEYAVRFSVYRVSLNDSISI
jgi:hypothetical protein